METQAVPDLVATSLTAPKTETAPLSSPRVQTPYLPGTRLAIADRTDGRYSRSFGHERFGQITGFCVAAAEAIDD
jgi:hypothetical protein